MSNRRSATTTEPAKSVDVSMRHWLDTWSSIRTDVSATQQKADRARIDAHLLPAFGRRSVERISPAQVVDWVDTLSEQGVGAATIVKSLTILRSTLDLAFTRLGIDKDNPARGATVAGVKTFRQINDHEILDEAQIQSIATSIDFFYRALFLLAVRIGAKWEELLGLRVTDVDLKNKRLTIGRIVISESGGRLSEGEGIARTVSLPDDVVEALRALFVETLDWRTPQKNWVFLTVRKHTHPLRPNFLIHVWAPTLRQAGLDKLNLTFSALRHTAAVRMIEADLPVEEISRILGHKNVLSTRIAYRRWLEVRGDIKATDPDVI